MRFYADLHVHSKYSRATSRDLDLEHLAYWACRKGLQVIATGDFTHPAWLAELKQKLVPAEPGLFRLRSEIEQEVTRLLPGACQANTRFMLSVEISTIYKKGDKTRKIHHLLYAPNFEAADRIVARLARIGNIASDGRPILGLDSRDLLEIVLESHPASYLVPAHIWTPWFAALGSKSGFDSIEECYGDLAGHIFAVETGLSSDPAMNWRLSMLDKYRLTSNSDAHSPGKLGREATVFDTDLDYFAIRRALENGEGYVGTVEFFPEEGKYHLDGHRSCGVRFTPQETLEHANRCPVCGGPITVGVLHRVESLADRREEDVVPPPTAGTVSNLVPLPEILSELVKSGPASKTVARNYDQMVATLGPELSILNTVPVEDIARTTSSLFAEAITRLRAGQVIRQSGYDGEYGVIRLFEEDELHQRTTGGTLFGSLDVGTETKASSKSTTRRKKGVSSQELAFHLGFENVTESSKQAAQQSAESTNDASAGILAKLDGNQRTAAETGEGSLIILAGPGSGKTRTLTHRLAYLISERGVPASSCLAITFTRRAADEMRERLRALLKEDADKISIHTFHALGLQILKENPEAAGLREGFRIVDEAERIALLTARMELSERKAGTLLRAISKAKRTQRGKNPEIAEALDIYNQALLSQNWVDFDDLVGLTVKVLSDHPTLALQYRNRFQWISVDEFQDVDEQQYQLLQLLAPAGANICVIGDPNQAIYGFRGADASCFQRFLGDYPNTQVVTLQRNYRSSGTIVTAASQVIARESSSDSGAIDTSLAMTPVVTREMLDRITVHVSTTEQAEAEFVVHSIEQLIGGHSFYSLDSGRATDATPLNLSFSDFAVLYRTEAQSAALSEAMHRSGIPFKKHGHTLLLERPEVHAILEVLRDSTDARSDTLQETLTATVQRVGQQDQVSQLDPISLQTALYQLLAIAESCGNNLDRFFETIATATEADTWDPRADRVSLLTLHASKGLEFPVVFIVGLEDGILPLYWGTEAPDAATVSEERRLLYVGMTRAQDRLILSRAEQRQWRGQLQRLKASPFLDDIEKALIEHKERKAPRAQPKSTQLTLL